MKREDLSRAFELSHLPSREWGSALLPEMRAMLGGNIRSVERYAS
jgi:hypothetical protein